MIMCPYCLTMQEPPQTNVCKNPNCGRKLPPRYVEYARKGNDTRLETFGLPKHGKTALLCMLMETAQNVTKIMPGSYVSALGDETLNTLSEWKGRIRGGDVKMPSTAPNERPLPLLVQYNTFLTTQPSILVAYDLAGEALVNAGSTPEMVRALSSVNTICYVVSLYDLVHKNEEGYDLAGLFNTYLEAMTSLQIPIKGKNVLVVYTKADILLGIHEGLESLPSEVIDYLGNDPYSQIRTKRSAELRPFDEDAYFAEMCKISDVLQEYTIDFVPGGGAFVTKVEAEGARVFFTINSAFGGDLGAENTRMGFAAQPFRVLDTLIWAIKLDHRTTSLETAQQLPTYSQAHGNLALQNSSNWTTFERIHPHFAAFFPREVSAETWSPLLSYVHIDSALEQVRQDARKFQPELGERPRETTSAFGQKRLYDHLSPV